MANLTIGELLRRHRLATEMTQKEIADLIGCHNSVVSRVEQGRQAPTPEYVTRFVAELHLAETDQAEIERVFQGHDAVQRQSRRREDWGEAPDVSVFYGRYADLATLTKWVETDRCRLVALLGMGGIGKTALATKLARQVADQFEAIIWRSLRNAPPLADVLAECVQFLSDQQEVNLPEESERRITRLIHYLDQERYLLILDNAESIMEAGQAGHYRQGYADYGRLFQRIGEGNHQSCVLLTSREKPGEVGRLEGEASPVRSYPLVGLDMEEGQQILINKGLVGSKTAKKALISHYSGNPLALTIVADMIREVYDRDIADFLTDEEIIFDEITDVLDEQFARLSSLEQSLMYWLAIEREPVSRDVLLDDLVEPVSKRQLAVALRSLRRRSLIEASGADFTLQNVVMEYVTERLIGQVCEEIIIGRMNLFHNHALIKATAKDYVRDSQIRLTLQPIREKLLVRSTAFQVENDLRRLVDICRDIRPKRTGYLAGNLLNVLCFLKTGLEGFDFSNILIRQAYLQQIELQDIDFSNSEFSETVFADTFGSGNIIQFSPNGKLLGIGASNGQVRIVDATNGVPLFICEGHETGGSIWSIAFSPDSQILASGSRDRTVRIWDTNTGQCLHIFREPYLVHRIRFSPDGRLLASNGGKVSIRVWGVDVRSLKYELQGHRDDVETIRFSPDGQLIASGSWDHTVRIWDAQTGESVHVLKEHVGPVRAISFAPDGNTLASSSADMTIRLWEVDTGQCLLILKGHRESVRDVTFSPDGYFLISQSQRALRVWDTKSGDCLQTLQASTRFVRGVRCDPSSQWLANVDIDHTLHLWELKTGRHIGLLIGHKSHIWSYEFHPDRAILASGSEDQTVRLWDIVSRQCLKMIQGYSSNVCTFLLDSEKGLLATGHEDHKIRLWNLDDGKCINTLSGHTYWVWTIAINPDQNILASGSFDSSIKLWDMKTGDNLMTLVSHRSSLSVVRFSNEGNLLASLSRDGQLYCWSVKSGKPIYQIRTQHVQRRSYIAFSPDDRFLANNSGHDVFLFDVASGDVAKVLKGHTEFVISFSFSPDGKIIATGSQDHTIRLWNVETGECLNQLKGHDGLVFKVAFNPAGNILASSGGDHVVKLWNVTTGHCVQKFEGHTESVTALSFNSKGKVLSSGSNDKTVRLWNVETAHCIKVLGGHRSSISKVTFDSRTGRLASGGWDDEVRLWDTETGKCIRIFRPDRPYERMNITGVTGLTEAQKDSLKALGAIEDPV